MTKRVPHRPRCPCEGTAQRRLYDVLIAAKGQPIWLSSPLFGKSYSSWLGLALEQLRNFYDLDVYRVPGSAKGQAHNQSRSGGLRINQYILAGQWINGDYVDYRACLSGLDTQRLDHE
jgi:hypothetical protein